MNSEFSTNAQLVIGLIAVIVVTPALIVGTISLVISWLKPEMPEPSSRAVERHSEVGHDYTAEMRGLSLWGNWKL
jgi:hypothetical protein